MTLMHEDNIQSAVDAVRGGAKQRTAAEYYDVRQSTISGRLHGAVSKKEAKLASIRLSPEEERFLVEWCLYEEAAGRLLSKARLKRIGEMVLKEVGDLKPLGARWLDRFLQRHTRIKTKKGLLLDVERKRGSTRAAYNDFYARLRH